MKRYLAILLPVILLMVGCTRDNGILDRPSYAFYDVSFTISTTPERFFELFVDDAMVSDSVSTNRLFSQKIAEGEHHFKFKNPESNEVFLDTIMQLKKTEKTVFSFLNLYPDKDPVEFAIEETPPPTNGFYKFSLINITADETSAFYDRNLDISFYEIDLNTYELTYAATLSVPRSGFSSYLELPYSYAGTPDAIYVIGVTDHDTGEVLINENDLSAAFDPLKDPKYNSYVLSWASGSQFSPISSKKL